MKLIPTCFYVLLVCTTLAQASFTEASFTEASFTEASFSKALDELTSTLPPGSIYGIEVRTANSGQLVYGKNNHVNLLPASIIKAATAITAYQVLGENFRYKTVIRSQRQPLRQRPYQGDLILTFSGDPSLTHENLSNLFQDIKRQGVREIKGNVWLDESVYSGYPKAGGTIWDDRNICFAAPAGAIILDRNCFFGWLKPAKKAGLPARMVYDQPGWQLEVDNKVTTRHPTKTEPLGCVQEVWPSSDYEYRLEGCITPDQKDLRMAFAARDVQRSAVRYVRSVLKRLGIQLKGRVLIGKPEGEFKHELASHYSEPLTTLLERVLEKSDNIYADSLLKTLGGVKSGIPGSYYLGTQTLREMMQEQGVDLERARLVDGSGLSRYNRLSAANMADMLAVGWQLWGEKASWLKQRENKEQWLKTGYMRGVNNMAGYVFPEQGQEPLIFVVILNGLKAKHPVSSDDAKAFHHNIRLFHRAFLREIKEHKYQ